MTVEGAQRLRDALHELKTVKRPAIIQAIADAREHGDLKENAEYHAAKERQGFLEGEMRSLEDKIARSQVVDPSTLSGEKVVFGATVKLLNQDTDEEVIYRIVGEDEADTKSGSISYKAPIARAITLMHREPARAWTLDSLAREVAMSRSKFSERFKALVGDTPMGYLGAHRMALAAEQLEAGRLPLAQVVQDAGYESDKVFARAFRRWAGLSPTAYAKRELARRAAMGTPTSAPTDDG